MAPTGSVAETFRESGSSPLQNEPRAGEGWRLLGWGLVALVVALVRNRLWATPNLAFLTLISERLGDNPFAGTPLASGDYLLTNVTGPALARLLGLTAPHQFVWLHLAVLLTGLAGLVALTHRRFGYRAARTLVALLAVAPVTTVTLEWLGQPDAFTLVAVLGMVVARRRSTVAALGVLAGLSHAEQGMFAACVAAVAIVAIDDAAPAPDRSTLRRLAGSLVAPLGGVVVGRLLVEAYLRAAGITITTPRTSFLDLGFDGFADHHLRSNGVLLYALWGPLWLGIVWVVARARRDPAARGRWIALALAAAAALVPMLVTLDETRVYSLVTAPLLVAAAHLASTGSVAGTFRETGRFPLQNEPGGRRPVRTTAPIAAAIAAATVAAAIVPGVFTAGEAYVATSLPVSEFAPFLANGDHPDDLTDWLMSPFGFEVPTAR